MPRPTPDLLDAIVADSEIRTLLGDSFDFYLTDGKDPDWFTIDGDADWRVIAQDGSGGPFLLFSTDERLAHIGSEGQAGIIAASLEEGLGLIVTYPYWRDLLFASVEAMRERVEELEESILGDIEDLHEHRAIVRERLGLKTGGDVLAKFHRAATTLGKDFVVRPPHEPDFKFDPLIR